MYDDGKHVIQLVHCLSVLKLSSIENEIASGCRFPFVVKNCLQFNNSMEYCNAEDRDPSHAQQFFFPNQLFKAGQALFAWSLSWQGMPFSGLMA